MFLQTNDRIINLQNVSNINILQNHFRIVFNLNYNIQIDYFDRKEGKEKSKFISDYVYWDGINNTDLQHNIDYIKQNDYFRDNFISQNNEQGFINKNEISSIKLSEKKHRVIFNLSHPVTFKDYDDNEKITSEFVYVNCGDLSHYKEYVQYVKDQLI